MKSISNKIHYPSDCFVVSFYSANKNIFGFKKWYVKSAVEKWNVKSAVSQSSISKSCMALLTKKHNSATMI